MIRQLIYLFTAVGTLFFSSAHFVDPWLVPKWCLLAIGISLWGAATAIRWAFPSARRTPCFQLWTVWVIILAVFAEAVYGIAQAWLSANSATLMKGTFDNTAGFAASLCVGFPFCLYVAASSKGWVRHAAAGIAVVLVITVLLSVSRAGILSLLAVSAVWAWRRLRLSSRVKWVALAGMFILSSATLYLVKKDSADGRLLIWRCTWEMMMDKPLLGWGVGGFEAHYMDYQAAYFERHPDSCYVPLADTVQYPFSEYLNIGVTWGMVGLLCVAALFVYLLRCYLRSPTIEKESALLCWVGMAVFAAFSYPLMYPFVWLMLAYAASLLLRGTKPVSLSPVCVRTGAVCLLALCVWIGGKTCWRIRAELAWAEVATTFAPEEDSARMQKKYGRIYATLKADRYFLYNYAAELNSRKRHDQSLQVAWECRRRWADYDLELLLAGLYEQKGDRTKAEAHYRKASLMCPNRFVPLYHRVLLLDRSGKRDEAKELARQIVEKPVKIPSHKVRMIKKEMNDYVINKSEY